jgi:hypothetical protein
MVELSHELTSIPRHSGRNDAALFRGRQRTVSWHAGRRAVLGEVEKFNVDRAQGLVRRVGFLRGPCGDGVVWQRLCVGQVSAMRGLQLLASGGR